MAKLTYIVYFWVKNVLTSFFAPFSKTLAQFWLNHLLTHYLPAGGMGRIFFSCTFFARLSFISTSQGPIIYSDYPSWEKKSNLNRDRIKPTPSLSRNDDDLKFDRGYLSFSLKRFGCIKLLGIFKRYRMLEFKRCVNSCLITAHRIGYIGTFKKE